MTKWVWDYFTASVRVKGRRGFINSVVAFSLRPLRPLREVPSHRYDLDPADGKQTAISVSTRSFNALELVGLEMTIRFGLSKACVFGYD